MKLIFIFILMSSSIMLYPFSYDSAIYAAQKGDIKSADEQMRTIIVDFPDDAGVLYDAGVLAHQLNNTNQAAAYFARSASCTNDDKDLCFRAHFNAGNACVDTKDLKAALSHYDAALQIDPDNEYARHNRDKVKQMLQEQEQQQDQQNDKNEQQEDKDQEQNDQQDKKDQQKDQKQSGNEKDDQQQKNDQKQDQDSDSENGSDQKSEQKSKGDKGESSKKDGNGEQGKQQGDTDQRDQKPGKDKERDGDQGLDNKSQGTQDKREPQQGKQHEKTPEQDKTNNENSIPSQGEQEQGQASAEAGEQAEVDKFAEKINDPWLLGILNEQEAHDKEVNKKLMEARIRQHGGKNGQNCW